MDVNENTPRTEIVIQGATFIVPEPFKEGYALKANEAAALNQVLHENLRNNFAKKVAVALEEVGGSVDNLDMTALQDQLDEYANTYEFGVRRGGTRISINPVEREAIKIAAKKVRMALRQKGLSEKNLPEGKFDELVEQLAVRPEIIEAATKIVEATKDVANITIDA